MCKFDHSLRLRWIGLWHTNGQFDSESVAAFRIRPDSHSGFDGGLGRNPDLQLLPSSFDGAHKAGSVSGSKELLRIDTIASRAADLFGYGKLQVELTVLGPSSSVATSGGGGSSAIFHIDRQGISYWLEGWMRAIRRTDG